MQLAMAAMSQFGGGRSVPVSGGMPMPMTMRPLAPYRSPAPVSNGWQPSMQAITCWIGRVRPWAGPGTGVGRYRSQWWIAPSIQPEVAGHCSMATPPGAIGRGLRYRWQMVIKAEVRGKVSASIPTAEAQENAMQVHLIAWHSHRLPSQVQRCSHKHKKMNDDAARKMESLQCPHMKSTSQMAAINVPISVTTQTSRESL